MTPAVCVPSPQFTVAVKSLALLSVSLSVKFATVPLNATPGLAVNVSPCGVNASPSATATLPLSGSVLSFAL